MKEITTIILSDTELGKKDLYDDFQNEEKVLLKFLKKFENKNNTTIVFNGDTFDFLKMTDKNDKHPVHIEESLSVWKMKRIIHFYPDFFKILKNFLGKKNNKVFFVIGNHDMDLHWPKVQKVIKNTLRSKKVYFDIAYKTENIHAEHGNQLDFLYQYKKPYSKKNGEKILKLPIGHYLVTKYFIKLKEKFPEQEKVYPRRRLILKDKQFKKQSFRLFLKLNLKMEPIFAFFNPFRKTGKASLFKLICFITKFGTKFLDDNAFARIRFNTLKRKNPEKKIFILGHSHIKHWHTDEKKKIEIISDTWREEYYLEDGLTKKSKSYVMIIENSEEKTIKAELKIINENIASFEKKQLKC